MIRVSVSVSWPLCPGAWSVILFEQIFDIGNDTREAGGRLVFNQQRESEHLEYGLVRFDLVFMRRNIYIGWGLVEYIWFCTVEMNILISPTSWASVITRDDKIEIPPGSGLNDQYKGWLVFTLCFGDLYFQILNLSHQQQYSVFSCSLPCFIENERVSLHLHKTSYITTLHFARTGVITEFSTQLYKYGLLKIASVISPAQYQNLANQPETQLETDCCDVICGLSIGFL